MLKKLWDLYGTASRNDLKPKTMQNYVVTFGIVAYFLIVLAWVVHTINLEYANLGIFLTEVAKLLISLILLRLLQAILYNFFGTADHIAQIAECVCEEDSAQVDPSPLVNLDSLPGDFVPAPKGNDVKFCKYCGAKNDKSSSKCRLCDASI